MASRSTKPTRCRHSSSTVCTQCRREGQTLQQVGSWARGSSRNESNDYESFLRNNPDALSPSRNPGIPTTMPIRNQPTSTQPSKSKSKTKPSSSQPPTHQQTKPHHQTPPTKQQQQQQASKPTTTTTTKPAASTSSIAATRSTSPSLYRQPTTTPAFNARQNLSATANAALVARERALLAQRQANGAESDESESEASESESDEDSDEE
ncbi:hypothetical protein Q7P37_002688 [Cladosporium fusiforme]